jgi:hypothetical protein
MKWSPIALGCLGLLGACGNEAAPRPRGLLGPDGKALAQEKPPAAEEPSAEVEEAPEPDLPDLPSPFDQPDPGALMAPEGTEPTPEAAPEPKPERDLTKEVADLLQSPASCIDLAKVAESGGKLSIGITAAVMPSGHFSRVSISAPGQTPEAIKCLQARVSNAAIGADVPDAPRTIQATVPVEVVSQGKPAPARTEAPAPAPLPENVAQPEPGEIAQPDGQDIAQPTQ